MHVTDLEKGESFDIHANENQLLKPLDFWAVTVSMAGVTVRIFSVLRTQTDTLALKPGAYCGYIGQRTCCAEDL